MLNMNMKGVPSGVGSTHTGVTSGVGSTHMRVTSDVGSTDTGVTCGRQYFLHH
jgi:hypothetical protein